MTGGAREGAGRPQGATTKRHAEVLAKALDEGITPVEYMLNTLRSEDASEADKRWAAEKAAPYVHPRPAPMSRTVELELPDTSTIEGVDKALDAVIAAVAKGELGLDEGQTLTTLIEARRKSIETGELLERIKKLEERTALGS